MSLLSIGNQCKFLTFSMQNARYAYMFYVCKFQNITFSMYVSSKIYIHRYAYMYILTHI